MRCKAVVSNVSGPDSDAMESEEYGKEIARRVRFGATRRLAAPRTEPD